MSLLSTLKKAASGLASFKANTGYSKLSGLAATRKASVGGLQDWQAARRSPSSSSSSSKSREVNYNSDTTSSYDDYLKSKSRNNKNSVKASRNVYGGSSAVYDYGGSSGGSRKKSSSTDYDKESMDQIERQREASLRALQERLNKTKEGAKTTYESGLSQIENLVALLGGYFDAAKGGLQTQYDRGKEEFDKEKVSDVNKLRSFYAYAGIPDSEQAGQARERTNNVYAGRLNQLYQDFMQGVQELEQQKFGRLAEYDNRKIGLKTEYDNTLREAEAQNEEGAAAAEANIGQLLNDLRDYSLKQQDMDMRAQSLDLDRIRTMYQVNKPYFSNSGKSGVASKGFASTFNPATGQVEYIYNDGLGNASPVSLDQYRAAKFPQYDFTAGQALSGIPGLSTPTPGTVDPNNPFANVSDEELNKIIYGY